MKCQKSSSTNTNKGLSLTAIIIVAFAIMISCVIIYFLVFAPLISPFFFSDKSIYKGILWYQDKKYLSLDNGREFQKAIQAYDVESKGELVNFYYIDNHIQDNPFYGKAPDIYALDIVAASDTYNAEKQIMAEREGTSAWISDFLLYGFLDKAIADDSVIVVSFCDKTSTIRYMLITDCDELYGIETLIIRNSKMEWQVKPTD